MTAFTTIPDSSIDANSVLDVALLTALRDNSLAIAEGAEGAPKIMTAAINDGAVTVAKLPSLAAGTSYENIIPSCTDSVYSNSGVMTANYAEYFNARILQTGTYRCYFSLYTISGTAWARLYKNGSAIGTERSTTSGANYTEDIAFVAGDTVQLYGKGNGTGPDCHNFKLGINQGTFLITATPVALMLGDR